jgi:hypothetical protein
MLEEVLIDFKLVSVTLKNTKRIFILQAVGLQVYIKPLCPKTIARTVN